LKVLIVVLINLIVYCWPLANSNAQLDIPNDSVRIEEIVITHSKIASSKKSSSKSLQVIEEAEIQKSLGKDLASLLRDAGGLLVNGVSSNPGKDKILYLQGAAGEYTLILLNGLPMVDPSVIGGSFDLRLFPLDQIRRIEILKGSASNLYGSDAIAGVINIITYDRSQDGTAISGNIAYGSYQQLKSNVSTQAAWKNIQYQLTLSYQEAEGISEASDRLSSGKYEPDGYKHFGLYTFLKFSPSNNWHISPFFRYTDYSGGFDDGAFTDGSNTYEAQVFHQGIKTGYSNQNVNIEGSFHYTESHRKFDSSFGESNFKGFFHQAEIFSEYRINPSLRLLGGVNFQHLSFEDAVPAFEKKLSEIFSPFINARITIGDDINLETGYRYNHHNSFGSHYSFSGSAGYWLNQEFKIYGSISNGFKSPGLFQLYGQFGANPDLQPQTSVSFESGISYSSSTEKLELQLNYFNRAINDIIVYTFFEGYFNQDKQKDQGIELMINWQIVPALKLTSNYAFLTGETNSVTEAGIDTSYQQLLRRPKHRYSIGLDFQATPKLNVFLQWHQIGEREDVFFNPANFFSAEAVILSSYYELNARVQYTFPKNKYRMFLQLNNITDQDFEEVYGFNTKGFNLLGGFYFKL
jgi:vitamin B12 transporter